MASSTDPLRVAAVPMRDLHGLTRNLCESLAGDYHELWIIDNGSTDRLARAWLRAVELEGRYGAEVVRWGPARGIYAMWNYATDRAAALEADTGQPVHLAILNNDVRLSPGALSDLSAALSVAPPDVAVVYPHWQATCERCSIVDGWHRTSGTRNRGGLAGYAFMFRPAALGVRFDEGYVWLAGDGDWITKVEASGRCAAAIPEVGVEHVERASSARHGWTRRAGAADMARSREPGRHNHEP